MSFEILILGSNSALPSYGRHHTSQIVSVGGKKIMIDCGEGTQYQLQKYKVKSSKIECIFISHLHGDHYLGLMGFLFSQNLSGREKPLHVFGPQGLNEIITTQLKYSNSQIRYELHFTETQTTGMNQIWEDEHFNVFSFPLIHRIPCTGFLVKEKKKPYRIVGDKIPENFSTEHFNILKQGHDITDPISNKVIYAASEYTLPPLPSRTYTYCSDTGYDPDIKHFIEGVDLLYHEATFLKEGEQWARETFHSTTHDAANLAVAAKVKQLLIGHFSARYQDLNPFLEETKSVFNNSFLAEEGSTFEIENE